MECLWKHPFSAILAGPSGCGKTYFVKHFLQCLPQMVNVKFNNILVCYGEWQSAYNDFPGFVQFREGMPNIDQFVPNSGPHLIIIDDQMRECDQRVTDLFTKGCHHRDISLFFITQNLFHQGKGNRDISLNSHYIVCFKNPRDRAQINYFSKQVYPENPNFIKDAYYNATAEPHGYLLFDLKQNTPEEVRFRSRIFPDDDINYVYIPTKKASIITSRLFCHHGSKSETR